MRLILVMLFLLLYFIVSIPIFGIEWIIGKINPHARDISSLRIVQFGFKGILFFSGTKTTVIGFENIPKDKPVLFVGNHKSFYDVIISYSMMPNLTGFVAKKEIEKVPLLRTWMRFVYCLFLDRDNLKEGLKTILQGIEYIKRGISIVIFPEGTRNTFEDGMLPFKEGSLKIAEKSGCPVVPVAITGTAEILEKHFPFIRPSHVTIEFGKPFYIKELPAEDRKRAGAYSEARIREMLVKEQEERRSLRKA